MQRSATKNAYDKKRSAIIERGLSVRAWAMRNNFPVGSVYSALAHRRNGPKANLIRKQLEEFIHA